MANQNIYSVQLLNDLHNYFPELLYNSRRFQNVQDVLGYIRGVSEISPYDRGLQQYRMRQRTRTSLPISRYTNFSNPIISIPTTGMSVPNTSVPNTSVPNMSVPNTSVPNTSVPNMSVPNTSINSTFVNSTQASISDATLPRIRLNTNRTDVMDSFLGGLSIILGSTNGGIMTMNEQAVEEQLQSFLNQSVPVYPTTREIDNASTTFITTEQQDDNCAICQDEIESNQTVRRLTHCNHYFHQLCIDTWFQRNVHCPTCRHDIRIVSQDE